MNLRFFLLYLICKCFDAVTSKLVKPFSHSRENEKMLGWYLEWDRRKRQHWIATFSMPLFGGIHPKNIFATRIGDLKQTIIDTFPHKIRVLDFGCGSGKTLEHLASTIDSGLGIEMSHSSKPSHLKVIAHHPNIAFEYGNYSPEALQNRIQTFKPDLVILSHVLEHLKEPLDFLRAFHPTPILICVPSESSWIQMLRKNLGLSTSSDSTHYREYTIESAKIELALANYKVVTAHFNSEGEITLLAKHV